MRTSRRVNLRCPTITAQPLSMGRVTTLGAEGWYCIPCHPRTAFDCDWPTYAMLGLDPASLAKGNVNPADPILPVTEADDIISAHPTALRHRHTRLVAMDAFPFIYSTVTFWFGPCATYEGVYGVEDLPWYPSHAPNYYPDPPCGGIGCGCRGGPVWHVGFSHSKVKTRDLSVLERCTEDAYRKTEHCLGVIWSDGGSTNLLTLLHLNDLTDGILSNLYFTAQTDAKGEKNVVTNNVLEFLGKPNDMEPRVFHIELRHREKGDAVFDRLWLVVNSPETLVRFNLWYAINSANMDWTLTLPPPFTSIDISGKLVSPDKNKWETPEKKSTYLHHNAVYDMRSERVTGGYGHQACYDAKGFLITNTIAAGTADLVAPYWKGMPVFAKEHRNEDVYPFIRALQLDGNPCLVKTLTIPKTLSRPCVYQGDYLDQYLKCRPIIPTGTQPRPQKGE